MPTSEREAPGRGLAGALRSRTALLLAFYFPTLAPWRLLAAALIIAAVLHGAWVKAGRPRGIRNVAAEAEEVPG